MARVVLDTRDRESVRRVRRLIRKWFGQDAEMVFGEATDNVLDHTVHKKEDISLHAHGFRVSNFGAPVTPEGRTKFIHNEHRQSGYGLLMMAALGGELQIGVDGTRIDWKRENKAATACVARG